MPRERGTVWVQTTEFILQSTQAQSLEVPEICELNIEFISF